MEGQSLTSAVEKTAELAGRRWARVLPTYRALQMPHPDFIGLPKSKGRLIWGASPNYIARLLIAIAGSDDPDQALTMVETFIWGNLDGKEKGTSVEAELAKYLTDPKAAENLERVTFYPATGRTCFVLKRGRERWFWLEQGKTRNNGTVHTTSNNSGIIRRNGEIDDELFRALCREIRWDHGGGPLINPSPADAED